MATKKSTPKKTNTTRAPRGEAQRSTKSKTSTVASTAKKAFDEGIREITGAKASAARSAATSGAKGRTIPAATKEKKQTSGTKTSTPKTSNASTARGQRLNSSASMPKGNTRTEYPKEGRYPNFNPRPVSENAERSRGVAASYSDYYTSTAPGIYKNEGRINDRAKNRAKK